MLSPAPVDPAEDPAVARHPSAASLCDACSSFSAFLYFHFSSKLGSGLNISDTFLT